VGKSAQVYDKAIRIDSRAPPDLIAQLDWLFGPDNQSAEARFEVFSAKSHREKFDDIERMRNRPKRADLRPVPTTPGVGQWSNG